MLMEDLLETTIIEEILPDFKDQTGITVNFEKVAYPVMHEKLVPQLAAGPGNGSYDVLEVDFYWVYEFARSGLGRRSRSAYRRLKRSARSGTLHSRAARHRLDVDDKTFYVPMYPYPMGLIYREDLLDDEAFQAAYQRADWH